LRKELQFVAIAAEIECREQTVCGEEKWMGGGVVVLGRERERERERERKRERERGADQRRPLDPGASHECMDTIHGANANDFASVACICGSFIRFDSP
jgi:hypothetical protein